jgi:lipoprotein-anchoring transpeptidase ErfK/SrfK
MGSSGPAVAAVKRRLADLRYDPGALDDRFDYATYHAVVAFQKVQGLTRNGRVMPVTAAAMISATLPQPMIPAAEATRVEVDLTRQVLLFWQDGKLLRILPVSSGYGGHYCGKDGSCGIATTPTGSYRATSKIQGRHVSPLGELWNPVFFNGGIAVHGEPDVPVTPASHGCIRVPMNDSMWVFDRMPMGTPVYVRDDAHTPIPFNQGGTAGPRQPSA